MEILVHIKFLAKIKLIKFISLTKNKFQDFMAKDSYVTPDS